MFGHVFQSVFMPLWSGRSLINCSINEAFIKYFIKGQCYTANMSLQFVNKLHLLCDRRADIVFAVNSRNCNGRCLCLLASGMAAGPVQALRGQWTWYSFHMALRS